MKFITAKQLIAARTEDIERIEFRRVVARGRVERTTKPRSTDDRIVFMYLKEKRALRDSSGEERGQWTYKLEISLEFFTRMKLVRTRRWS